MKVKNDWLIERLDDIEKVIRKDVPTPKVVVRYHYFNVSDVEETLEDFCQEHDDEDLKLLCTLILKYLDGCERVCAYIRAEYAPVIELIGTMWRAKALEIVNEHLYQQVDDVINPISPGMATGLKEYLSETRQIIRIYIALHHDLEPKKK